MLDKGRFHSCPRKLLASITSHNPAKSWSSGDGRRWCSIRWLTTSNLRIQRRSPSSTAAYYLYQTLRLFAPWFAVLGFLTVGPVVFGIRCSMFLARLIARGTDTRSLCHLSAQPTYWRACKHILCKAFFLSRRRCARICARQSKHTDGGMSLKCSV